MKFMKGDKVTLAEAMRKSVRNPARYAIGIVAGLCGNGTVEILWGGRNYAVCMKENEIVKLQEQPQMPLF